MIKFWKEHAVLRMALIALFFFGGMALIYAGWKMTASMTGLLIMFGGLALLLVALWLYNKPFQDPPKPRK